MSKWVLNLSIHLCLCMSVKNPTAFHGRCSCGKWTEQNRKPAVAPAFWQRLPGQMGSKKGAQREGNCGRERAVHSAPQRAQSALISQFR